MLAGMAESHSEDGYETAEAEEMEPNPEDDEEAEKTDDGDKAGGTADVIPSRTVDDDGMSWEVDEGANLGAVSTAVFEDSGPAVPGDAMDGRPETAGWAGAALNTFPTMLVSETVKMWLS